jgi:hypothetical protein
MNCALSSSRAAATARRVTTTGAGARLALVALSATMLGVAQAASPAASACPPVSFLSGNLAVNPEFELPAAGAAAGSLVCWQAGLSLPAASAADGWLMHTDNAGTRVCSRLVNGGAPGAKGARMLAFQAGAAEGGVYQSHALDPARAYMFSVWVQARRGQVVIQSRNMSGGPVAWTTKVGEWEQLRVCTNSLANTDALVIYNQAPSGGTFLVDRVELREIAVRE